MKKFLKLFLCLSICLIGTILLVSCGKREESGMSNDDQIRAIYELAVDAGETRTYEEWLNSIKGENGKDGKDGKDGKNGTNGLTPYIGSNGNWFIGSTDTGVKAQGQKGDKGDKGDTGATGAQGQQGEQGPQGNPGKDATYETYTVTYDYGVAQNLFNEYDEDAQTIKISDTIKSTQWITSLPTIKDEYKDTFLGWFIAGEDKQIVNYDFIGGDVMLEARFIIGQNSLPGLYQNGKYVKTWSQLGFWPENKIYTKNQWNDSYFEYESGDLIIQDGITDIGDYAFNRCEKLTSILIPNSVLNIGKKAFINCTALENINIPLQIKTLNDSTFSGCVCLKSVIIPDGVTSIGQLAFADCAKLVTVSLPSSITNIESSSFSGCKSLANIDIPTGISHIYFDTFCGCESLKEVIIPSGVRYIGYSAFEDCVNLTSISIPGTVSEIESGAFAGCIALDKIIVADDNINYSFVGNCLIENKTNTVIAGCMNSIIPTDGSVTDIGIKAFMKCVNLQRLVIPMGVKFISNNAFSGCVNLSSLILPSSLISISSSAFYNCFNLNTIYFIGSQEDFKSITIDAGNDSLIAANIYFYSLLEPTEEGNFWHYDTDGVTPVIW